MQSIAGGREAAVERWRARGRANPAFSDPSATSVGEEGVGEGVCVSDPLLVWLILLTVWIRRTQVLIGGLLALSATVTQFRDNKPASPHDAACAL